MDEPRAISKEEWMQFLRNKQPPDHFFVGRMIQTITRLIALEMACRLLCRFVPGVYSNIESALGALDASREG